MTDTSVADTAPPSSAAAALSPPAAPPPPPFYEGFSDAGLKDWAGKNKFESPEAVAALAHKFDAFKDADPATLARLPGADAKPEDHVALLDRIGAPKEPSAYGLDKIEGVDATLATEAQGWFHEARLLPWQARLVAEKQMAFAKAQQDALVADERVAGERELAALKTGEWAGKYDEQLALGQRALRYGAQKAGLKSEEVTQFVAFMEQGVGTAAAMKIAAVFGGFLKEGDLIEGDTKEPAPNNMAARWYGG